MRPSSLRVIPFSILGLLMFSFVALLTACIRRPHHTSLNVVTEASGQVEASRININTATAAQLEKLPGIGPVVAERIVAYRLANGRFRRVEHLMMVRGISERRFLEVRPMVKVD